MSTAATPVVDALATVADRDSQRQAARMAQEVFASLFRQSAEPSGPAAARVLAELETRCYNWSQAGEGADGRAVRLALLISGLDQWGLAYSQAFNLLAMPALSSLLGGLRSRLDSQADARFQWFFSQIEQVEGDAIDFKVELRRAIHLALWHAMAACDTAEAAEPILRALGSMMLALNERMPEMGWRLLADALAHIQVGLLNDQMASVVAQNATQQLFESLRQALRAERYQSILAHSGQVVLAWQQARRAKQGGMA